MQDSGHKPFSHLDIFISQNNIRLRDTIETNRSIPGEDDCTLFTDAMKGVRIVSSTRRRVGPECSRQVKHKQHDDATFAEVLRSSSRLNTVSLPEFMEGFAEGINALTLEKLKKGEFSVQRTLDLHGFAVKDASELFQEFIRDAVRQGLHCVKIIHGRGLKSKGTPVLRENLKSWIVRAMHRKWVIAFSNAIMAEGGPGATYILLKKHPKKRRIHIIG